MSFWTWLTGSASGETPNSNPGSSVGPPDYRPGDPNGFEFDPPPPVVNRSFGQLSPSPWSGWPAEWSTPSFNGKVEPLVDTAWHCMDLQASILSTMPTYLDRGGVTLPPTSWMQNPDPTLYESWIEFANELFFDYQLGEAFVLSLARNAQGYPASFRCVPPWLMFPYFDGNGQRQYKLGGERGTPLDPADVLHIRYHTARRLPRGIGPLEIANGRVVAAGLLMRLVSRVAEQGGVPNYWLESDKPLTRDQASSLLDEWVDSRIRNVGRPALLTQGVKASTLPVSTREMALLELGQWTESRIALQLGVPPFLVGLPSGGDSMTYSNVTQLFDFHDRSSLRPKAKAVMSALSNWALPRGQCVQLDSEEYIRPGLYERAQSYQILVNMGAMTGEEVRTLERLNADGSPAPSGPPQATMQGGDGT